MHQALLQRQPAQTDRHTNSLLSTLTTTHTLSLLFTQNFAEMQTPQSAPSFDQPQTSSPKPQQTLLLLLLLWQRWQACQHLLQELLLQLQSLLLLLQLLLQAQHQVTVP